MFALKNSRIISKNFLLRRWSHTDLKVPDFNEYREDSGKKPLTEKENFKRKTIQALITSGKKNCYP